jgi:hypothetical protein
MFLHLGSIRATWRRGGCYLVRRVSSRLPKRHFDVPGEPSGAVYFSLI